MHAVHASAPAKLVVAGDYAVLEGAPAVVIALDRRAHVEVESLADTDAAFCIDAPDLDIRGAQGRLEGERITWSSDADRLTLVTAVLQYLAQHGAAPRSAHVTLDTQAFFAGDGAKLGLGSSAALTVALTAAVNTANDAEAGDLAAMIGMHRRMQGGRGSGLDIAAALMGGTLIYRLSDGQAQTERARWPHELGLCCVWSGRSASTGSALAQLADWRSRHTAAYATHMQALSDAAAEVAVALRAGSGADMATGMSEYADMLARFGETVGIDIVSAEHRALAAMANDCGVVYKSCGAGGGDVGMAVAVDDDRLSHFARQAASAGFRIVETGIDERGLSVQTANTSHRRQPWTTYA
ncbi:MAG TPA: hypothetical protein VFJ15_05850 [Oleiagrimonas sp.]|nr:hypothetical protein [Oleiagrimonas sp.]